MTKSLTNHRIPAAGSKFARPSPDHANVSDISMHNTLDIDEKATAPNLLQIPMALKAREIPHELHVYDGGHDWGWWRAALLEHLGAQPVKARWADFGAEFGV